MNFISVRRLAAYFKLDSSRVDNELLKSLRNAINQYFQNNTILNIFDYTFTFQELTFVLDQLNDEKVKLFHGWIEQDSILVEYLMSSGENILLNEEIVLPKEHQLFEAYQVFLTLYLEPIISKNIILSIQEKDLESLGNHLIFSPLLVTEKRIELQQPVSLYLRQLLGQLKVSQGVGLQEQLKLVYSYSFIQVLNKLDNNFHSDAISYIDTAKLVVLNSELSPLVLDKIKSAVLSVRLNKHHREQVLVFCSSKSFTAKSKAPRSTLNNMVRSPLFFVAVIAIFINFFFLYPTEKSNKNKASLKEVSGIDGLSDEEMHEVDTMLGFKQDSIPVQNETLPAATSPKYILTNDWKNIENTIAREIYSSMIADYEIQKNLGISNKCTETKKELYGQPLYSNILAFSHFSSTNSTILNKSGSDLYVLTFEPQKKGKIYGTLIAANRSSKVYLKKGDMLIFYSGQQMNAFNPMRTENNGYGGVENTRKVSTDFNFHFCGQNAYHFQQLNKVFVVEEVYDVVFEETENGFGVRGLTEKL